jgi:hypothetical protein
VSAGVSAVQTRPRRESSEVGAEIVAALMHGPRTWPEIEEQVGISATHSLKWLRQFRASGVLRIKGYRATGKRRARVWELQAPFAKPDEIDTWVDA